MPNPKDLSPAAQALRDRNQRRVPELKDIVDPAAQAARDAAMADTSTVQGSLVQALRDAMKNDNDAALARIAKRAEHTPSERP